MTNKWRDSNLRLQSSLSGMFGETYKYHPTIENHPSSGGFAVDIVGVFDQNRKEVSIGRTGSSLVNAAITSKTFEFKESDLPFTAKKKDSVEIGGRKYIIVEVQPDGAGVVLLVLRKKGEA